MAVAAGLQAEAATVIHAGQVIDGISAEPLGESTITVADGRIQSIEAGHLAPEGSDRLVDLRSHTVMPGLIDMHVHLDDELSPDSYMHRFQWSGADYALYAAHNARKTLMAGFTTVRNPGDKHNSTVALREAIARGLVPGPRIFTAAKSIATTGGHADPTNGWAGHLRGEVGPDQGVADGPDEAVAAVRQRYKDGADFIKITATGGVLSLAKNGLNPQFTEEELRAIVDTARDYGYHVAAHAHGAEGMKRAIRAGVTTIEHGTYMDDEVIELMKEYGTYYVPTLLAGVFVAEKAREDGFFPAVVRPKAASIGPQLADTFARAYRKGVPIVFGTDSGVSPHGDNGREFILMVRGGMPAMEAILSATSVPAALLGVEDRLGSLEPGKLADIVAVEGDPLADIGVMTDIRFVMKEGEIHKQP